MMLKFLLLAYLLQMAVALPQFITYKDGKFGVNFGGYHAEAGLGGLLTGDAAHGGLSASAGTPHGQRAGAGLGGSVDGNAAGLLYAGAEANPQVGAAAVLGGDTNKGGFMGAQAFSNGKTVASTKSHTFTRTKSHNSQLETMGNDEPVSVDVKSDVESVHTVQKVKPPKKYHVQKHRIYYTPNTEVNVPPKTKYLIKNVEQPQLDYPAAPASTETKVNIRPAVVTSALQIPIGILRSLQESLGGLSVAKQGSVQIN